MTLQELGQSLKEQREAMGLSLDDIATRIKISTRILRSIEEGSMVGMPHAVYTKRFIRSFGEVIGYDSDDLNAKLDIVFPPESLEDNRNDYGLLNRIEPPAYGGLKRVLGLFFVLAVFVGLAAGGWFVAKNYGDAIWNLIKQPFSAVSTPAANRTESVNSYGRTDGLSVAVPPRHTEMPAPAAAQPSSAAPQSQVPAQQADAPYSPVSPAYSAAAPPASSAPAAAPQNPPAQEQIAAPATIMPATGTMQQVLITAREECWLSARADGARGRDYTLRPGESFVLTYTNNLDLSLGNGGGVSIIHNGKNLGRPGAPGQRVDLHFPMPGN